MLLGKIPGNALKSAFQSFPRIHRLSPRVDILKIHPLQRRAAAARHAVPLPKRAADPADCKTLWFDGSYSMDGWLGCAVVHEENGVWKGRTFALAG